MNLTQLEYFCKTAELLSFSGAADALYVSQSTISKSLSALEKELGSKLFVKQGRYLHLSRSGQIVLEHAREILQFYQKETEAIYQQLGLSNARLTVGIPPTAGGIFFYKVVDKFHSMHPQTELIIEEGTSKTVVERLLNRSEDIGIVIEPFHHPDMISFPVVESESVLLVSKNHPLAGQEKTSLSQLGQEKFALISKDFMYHDLIERLFEQAHISPCVVCESPHWEWVYSMVAGNQAVSILPYPLVQNFANDNVCLVRLENPVFPWTLSVVYHKHSILSEAMKTFIALCQREAGS